MPACVINDLEVTDPVIFDEDRKRSPPTLAQFGGRFVVRGGAVGSLEGDWLRKRLVVNPVRPTPGIAPARGRAASILPHRLPAATPSDPSPAPCNP